MDVNKLIHTIRNSDLYIENIYLSGDCYQFYKILKVIYPDAKAHINQEKDHIVTMIDGEFYDITGKVNGNFTSLDETDIVMCEKWSFYKNHWLYRECPICEEPVFSN